MSALTDTYADVQAIKEDTRGLHAPVSINERIRNALRTHLGRDISEVELQATVEGIGWVARMAAEHDLSLVELLEIADRLEANVLGNIDTTAFNGRDGVRIGVGAGFFSGLYVGMKMP